MAKQIPLVMYSRGVRVIVGMVSVKDDGSIESQFKKDLWPSIRDSFLPFVKEFSINPAPSELTDRKTQGEL